MNYINIKGLLRNIRPSHKIKDIEYCRADVITKRKDGKEDVINLRFKKFSNPYVEGQEISLVGNVRSYSQQLEGGKNKVELYVFTYFDIPQVEDGIEETNHFCIDGRICKIEPVRITKDGKQNIHFILANNLIVQDSKQKLNSYLPCIAWNSIAKQVETLQVNDRVQIEGELHSREYKKIVNVESGEFEFRVAHECVINSVKVISEPSDRGDV